MERRRQSALELDEVFSTDSLRRVLQAYVEYYLKSRTHLSLDKDAPVSRPIAPPGDGVIVSIPHLGRLHHRYERHAA
jgi:hypothetical protein